jgi:6,7-dimethyl-8-ribityllumazine synthase
MKTDKAQLPALDLPVGARLIVIEARYYAEINDQLLSGIKSVAAYYNVPVEVKTVPGSLEIPQALQFVALGEESRDDDAYVVVGCVIRGETTHYETVCNESNRGVMDVALSHYLAVGNAILTVENMDQAIERADPAKQDKGAGAALSALSLLSLKHKA